MTQGLIDLLSTPWSCAVVLGIAALDALVHVVPRVFERRLFVALAVALGIAVGATAVVELTWRLRR